MPLEKEENGVSVTPPAEKNQAPAAATNTEDAESKEGVAQTGAKPHESGAQPGQQQIPLQQLVQTLKSPHSPQQQKQVLTILKSNPQLMAAFIKQRSEHQQRMQQQQQQRHGPLQQGNMQAAGQPVPHQQMAQLNIQQQPAQQTVGGAAPDLQEETDMTPLDPQDQLSKFLEML